MSHLTILSCSIALSICLAPATAFAAEQVNFEDEVFSIFETRCNHCHGEDKQEARLRLDSKAIAMRGGISGAMIVPGKPEKSLLIERISSDANNERMPFEDEPLTADEIAVIERWIREGAKWPDGIGSTSTEIDIHWAYQPPVRPEPAKVKRTDWVRHPIDTFVLARLEQEGLSPSEPAVKAKLLRRLSLDLIGLPPTVEEVDAFLADDSETAYESAVDRLLNSKHYGERWARPWLDAARYADTNGYQADQYRDVWAFRDYVIRSLNEDKPFNRFTLQQIAGDLLPDATVEDKVASGFHRLTTCNVEAGVDPEENRVNQVIDRVNTTGYVWLGTSLECAQCHNHKYDPFSQTDYYRMFAFFNNTALEVRGTNGIQYEFEGPKMELPLTEAQQQQKAKLEVDKQYLVAKINMRLMQVVADLAREVAREQQDQPEESLDDSWHVLPVDGFASEGGAEYEVLDDESVLISGPKPATDTYIAFLTSDLPRITGIRLDALTHDSLPGKGPGRHHPERPNFVLHEIELERVAADGKAERIRLSDPEADFSQKQYDVAKAIDGDAKTTMSGWAIHAEFHKPHWASFRTEKPIELKEGEKLRVTLIQNHGDGRTLGRIKLSAMTGRTKPGDDSAKTPREIVKLLAADPTDWTDKQHERMLKHCLPRDVPLKKMHEELDKLLAKITAIKPATTLIMVEDTPRETHVFRRGNFKTPTDRKVSPGMPRALTSSSGSSESTATRIDLANWLTSRDNPLTARVQVNRIWAEIFGRGLVFTSEDFGTQGDPPTHPRVLDWLAVEFMESGWSQKHLIKQIVMSATYRQSSKITPELLEHDPDNQLLARGPRFRMAAEAIRDNGLVISGLFSGKMHGPPVYPPQPAGIWRHVGRNAPKYNTSTGDDRYRRALYTIWRRSAPPPSFMNFDAPDRASCTVKRPRTNTPLQALTLLNDLQYLEMSAALAGRMLTDQEDMSADARAAYGFRLATAREPTASELAVMVSLYEAQLKAFREEPKRADQLLKGLPAPDNIDRAEMAATMYLANVLLNLDETITKE